MTKITICPYCKQGHKPKDGKHWIVKSIIPARIDIRDCKGVEIIKEDK